MISNFSRTDYVRMVLLVCGFNLGIWGCAKPPAVTVGTAQKESATTASTTATNPSSASKEVAPDVVPLAKRILSVYRSQDGYSDQAEMVVTSVQATGDTQASFEFATSYFPPNRIRLRVASDDNRIQLTSDGTRIRTRISDPLTKDFGGQVITRSVSSSLHIADLYGATELIDPRNSSELLSLLLGAPAAIEQTPISLILGEGRLYELVAAAAGTPVPGGNGPAAKFRAHRKDDHDILELAAEEGIYHLWTSTDGLIKRIEYPKLSQGLADGIREIHLVSNLSSAQLHADPNDFQIDSAPVEHDVQRFVLPPLPLATKRLGEAIAPLALVSGSGVPRTLNQPDDGLLVLTWIHDHLASRGVSEQLEKLRQELRDQPVQFFLIRVDADFKNAVETVNLLKSWNVDASFLFDPQASGRDVLDVEEAPTTVVLDDHQRLHYFGVGANPAIASEVSVVINQLLRGDDAASLALKQYKAELKGYEEQLLLAESGRLPTPEEVLKELPAASQPKQVELREKWVNTELTEPGNMLILPGSRRGLFVLDGWNQLVELGSDGKLVRRIPLDLPAEEGVALLRGSFDAAGKPWIAAIARGGRHAFGFDLQGKQLWKFPAEPDSRASLQDLWPAVPPTETGVFAYVGWQQRLGIQGVDRQGNVVWNNRGIADVVSLTAGRDPEIPILVAGQGVPLVVALDGTTLRAIPAADLVVHHLAAWPGSADSFTAATRSLVIPQGSQIAIYCGLALAPDRSLVAVGLNQQWEVLWRYKLPVGVYAHQVDFPQSLTLASSEGACWLIPGTEGSVHLLSRDGKWSDQFYLGSHVRGLAAMTRDNQSLLLVATEGKVTCYVATRRPSADTSPNREGNEKRNKETEANSDDDGSEGILPEPIPEAE